MRDDLPLKYVMKVPSGAPDDASLPLVIVMHGRGADANDLADLAPLLDRGYRFLFPNAPKPFEAGPGVTFGFTWFDGLPPEPRSLAEARAQFLRFIDEAAARWAPPDGKIVLAGFSQGGVMALDAGFRTPTPLAGIVVMSGALAEDDLPDLKARREQPLLIVHGVYDDMIPIQFARRARHVLEEHGLQPEYHELPMGHHVTPESMGLVGRFVERVLSPESRVSPSGLPLAPTTPQDDSK
jgi:phospholipase/carboxylesterase